MPWRRRTTRQEIHLGIDPASCARLAGVVTSPDARAIVGDAEPIPFLAQPLAHTERFWPMGLEMFGSHGPHLYTFLKFLSQKLSEQALGSAASNLTQMRRTLSKLLHDHIGKMMNCHLKH